MIQNIIDQTISWLEYISQTVPPFQFIIIGSIVEEILSPIPSPLVMTLAGSLLAQQGLSHLHIALAALISSFIKTIISYFLYIFADKIEDLIPDKLLKLIGFEKDSFEKYGQKFSQGKKDFFIMLAFRSLPPFPTLPVSLAAGFLKIQMTTYITTTFIGFALRNLMYLYIGFYGLNYLETLQPYLDQAKNIIIATAVIVIIGTVFYFRYRKYNKQK